MTLALLLKLAVAAVKALVPEAADLPGLAAKLIADWRGHLPPVTHEDGTPIPLAELDARVDAAAVAAHVALHEGDQPTTG